MKIVNKSKGFTLSEVLITLGIIGVVAALTMPALINNASERALETGTSKFYTTLSNAVDQFFLRENIEEVAKLPKTEDTIDKFISNFKKTHKCTRGKSCFVGPYKKLTGSEFTNDDWTSMMYYGDFGAASSSSIVAKTYQLNDGADMMVEMNNRGMYVIVDINGKKGPNQVGRDFWQFSVRDGGDIYERYEEADEDDEALETRFETCKSGGYAGCFTHLKANNYKFDY